MLTPASSSDRSKWMAEFRNIGEERVRASLLGPTWSAEKRKAAREWIEQRDIEKWQKTSTGKPGLTAMRKKFKAGYIGGAIGLVFGLITVARLLRKF